MTPLTVADGGPCTYSGYEDGVIVSSVDYPFLDPRGRRDCYDRFIMATFPRTGAALALQPVASRPGAGPGRMLNTRFPITYRDLTHTGAIRGGPVSVSFRDIVLREAAVYRVRLWLGLDASAEDRATILGVLRSIRFLRGPAG